MKNAKKLVSIMLALVMVLAMAVTAFAADTTGSITIKNPMEGQTYNVYKMFDLEYNTTTKAYLYKVNDAKWETFAKGTFGSQYFNVDDNKYVTLKDGVTVEDNSETAALIAKEALKYAKENGITPVATASADNQYKATGLALGYYLVDSSLGALCGLTTTATEAEVNEKNGTPSVDKEVTETTAKIGQTVHFTTKIVVEDGAENYVLHDKMDKGLKLDETSIKVQVGGTDVDTTNYTKDTNPADAHAFDITFENAYVAGLTAGTKIVVTYSATLTEEAVIAGEGNKNETWLEYGDDNEINKTPTSTTTTYTYEFDLVKTDSDKKVLTGAEFALYDAETAGNQIALVEESEGVYRVATADDKGAAGFTSAVIKAGKATIKGLANGTYYLEETKSPEGYNKITARQPVKIENANNNATLSDAGASADSASLTYVSGGVQVVNYSGSELPSTGGVGTMIFYIVGGILLVGAGVLLVVRKRMNSETKSK